MKEISVIIPAGGLGKRMGTKLPKQFLMLDGLPVLMQTISCLHRFDAAAELIVALPKEWISYWEEEIRKHQFLIPHKIVEGGLERFHTVQKALQYCTNDYVAVHDAVRPLVSDETLTQLWEFVRAEKCVIPVVECRDSLREIDGNGSKAIDRKKIRLVQTPQCFPKKVLVESYQQAFDPFFTDDASVVERAGFSVELSEGNVENIKLTYSTDFIFAEAVLKENNK